MSQYLMKECVVCGAGLPVNPNKREITCGFCGSIYEVVKKLPHGKPSPGQLGWFLGGAFVGFLIGWPISRAALATVAKVSIGELEKKAEEWGKR